MANKVSYFIRQCELEAKYKFSTDIFTRGTLTERFRVSELVRKWQSHWLALTCYHLPGLMAFTYLGALFSET